MNHQRAVLLVTAGALALLALLFAVAGASFGPEGNGLGAAQPGQARIT
jgi:hypothetical protein